jgi:hypothetical protein
VFGGPLNLLCVTYEDGTPDDCNIVAVARPYSFDVRTLLAEVGATAAVTADADEEEEDDGAVLVVCPLSTEKTVAVEKPSWSELGDLMSTRLGGRVVFATDDWFAACESMISDEVPIFLPTKFSKWGKWMDGWESRRKRTAGHDWSILKLAMPATLYGFEVDT